MAKEEQKPLKWQGSTTGIVEAPIEKVWPIISQTKHLTKWMPMVENCSDLDGKEGVPDYVRLVSGFMFPLQDGERSWIKERLVSMDGSSYCYVYKMEGSNVGLDGLMNMLKLEKYGDGSTLVVWSFEIDPVEDGCEEGVVDLLGFVYKSCVNRISVAIQGMEESDV